MFERIKKTGIGKGESYVGRLSRKNMGTINRDVKYFENQKPVGESQ